MSDLTVWANLAAILTALIAIFGYGKYQLDAVFRRKKLENYLKKQKTLGNDQGQRSILHLMAHLGLTEAEILQASFISKQVARKIAKDPDTGYADKLLFEYME